MLSGKLFDHSPQAASIGYLHGRIREEAEAAVRAASLEATLAHVHLATAYAKRICQHSDGAAVSQDCWADHHRLW